ncbi:S41 family peptidase [Bacillus paralicheniformis]|uniref:S41 family peptidase n=1 Tax=Bacillus paralicheniformis TaxID=1648923 RepID=UPI00186B6BEB|nr:S41 family peptidase [Bacillus paralicheniformis]
MNQSNIFLAESLIHIVNENYLFTGNQRGTWNRISTLYLRKIRDSKVCVFDLLKNMILELHDPHTLFFHRNELHYCFDINLQWIGNQLFLMKNKNGYPGDYVGSKVLKINSFKIEDELKKQQKKYMRFPTSIFKKNIIQNIIEGKYGIEKLKLNVETIDKKRRTFVINSHAIKELFDYKSNIDEIKNNFKPIIFKIINSDTLLIKFFTFKFPGISKLFFSKLRFMKRFKYIIFDIRDNAGGFISETKQILSFIISKDILMDYKVLQNAEGKNEYKISSVQIISNQIPFFSKRKFFILCNSSTASSAEFIFLKGLLLSNEDLTIIGEQTAGLSGHAKIFTIDNQDIIQVTTKKFIDSQGKEIRNGIQPNYTVAPFIKDIINNKDTLLNFCLDKFKLV